MTSEWDETPWGGTAVVPEANNVVRQMPKAATGWQPIWTPNSVPSSEWARSPMKRMKGEQALYWSNPWIMSAEDAVTRRVSGLPWHLEDANEEELDGHPFVKLLEKPQAILDVRERQPGMLSWRNLVSVTSRHLGLCGMTHWFLDGIVNEIPQSILYLNPARLFPIMSPGGQLLAWKLDPKDDQGRGGTVLSLEEVLTFYLHPPDAGAIASGYVAAAALKARLTYLADTYTAGTFTSGGRIAGIVGPKEGTIPPDQFDTLVREFRNVNESGDSAHRTTVVRGPVEFHGTAANNEEMDVVGISKMSRDDIFGVWGVPLSQVGISTPTGLNGGERQSYEEATLYQGSVSDRVDVIRETVQALFDRSSNPPTLVIVEPEFDDETPAYELASKASNQPLTRNERREIIGLAPLPDYGPDGDPLGLAIDLPINLSVVGQGEEGEQVIEGRFTRAKPELEVSERPGLPPIVSRVPELPAVTPKAAPLREATVKKYEPALRKSVADVLSEQRTEIAGRIRERGEHISRNRNDSRTWWQAEKWNRRLLDALKRGAAGITEHVTTKLQGALAKADPFTDSVLDSVLTSVGVRVKGINDHSRDEIGKLVSEAFEQGLSPSEVADLIEGSTTFDAARAELIARTETALVYNEAALTSYKEYGVERVRVYDGDGDEICAPWDGWEGPLSEAPDLIGHPNCTRDFAPA